MDVSVLWMERCIVRHLNIERLLTTVYTLGIKHEIKSNWNNSDSHFLNVWLVHKHIVKLWIILTEWFSDWPRPLCWERILNVAHFTNVVKQKIPKKKAAECIWVKVNVYSMFITHVKYRYLKNVLKYKNKVFVFPTTACVVIFIEKDRSVDK